MKKAGDLTEVKRKTIIYGSLLSVLQNGVKITTSLISIPLAINYLGKERYGLWLLTSSTLLFITFLDAGLLPTIKNKMSEAFGKNDKEKFRYYSTGIISTSILIALIGGLLAVGISFINWINIFEVSDPDIAKEVNPLVMMIFFIGIMSISLGAVDNIFVARMRIVKIQIYAIIASITCFCLLLVGIKLKVSFSVLVLMNSAPLLCYRMLLLVELFFSERELIVPQFSTLGKLLKEVFPLSSAFFGIKIAELVLSMLPNLIVAKLLGLSSVAIFGVATRLASIPLLLETAILPVFWPVFTIAWSKSEINWLRNKLKQLVMLTLVFFCIYTVTIVIFGTTVIKWWTHGKLLVPKEVLLALCILVTVQATVYWLSTFLHSISDFRYELFCHLASAFTLICFGYLSTKWFNINGLIYVLIIAWSIGCLFPMIFRVNKFLVREN